MQEAGETEEGSQSRRGTCEAFSRNNRVPASAWCDLLACTSQHNSLQLVWSARKSAKPANSAECSHLPRRKIEIGNGCCAVGTEGAASPQEGRSCSPNACQEDIAGSAEKGSPGLHRTHSQSNAASPKEAASPSSKASDNEARSGSPGSKAGSAQPSGSQSLPTKQAGTSPASATQSGEASDDHGSGTACASMTLHDTRHPDCRERRHPCLCSFPLPCHNS